MKITRNFCRQTTVSDLILQIGKMKKKTNKQKKAKTKARPIDAKENSLSKSIFDTKARIALYR